MKQNILKNFLIACLLAIGFIASLQSCNKAIPGAVPITTTLNATTINNVLSTDPTDSLFNAAVVRAGLTSLLADSSGSTSVTVFVPTNAAMASIGLSTKAIINATPVATLQGIVNYLIIPGREFVYTDVPTTFPNIQLPTLLGIGANLPGTTIPIKLSAFLSRRTTGFWFNNIPVTTFDAHYRNGVVHSISGIPLPPSATLKTLINADPNLTYFSAAVIRGDSGQVGTNRIDSLLNYAVTNMTVFVPNDNAFKAVLTAQITAALVAQGVPLATAQAQATALAASPTVFSNPALYGALTANTIRGIVVYHFLAALVNTVPPSYQPIQRAFSVNFSNTATFYKTLVNNVVSVHPGISVQSFFNASGLAVDSMKVKGFANATSATSKPATSFDKHAVNGVYHVIDQVLLPQ